MCLLGWCLNRLGAASYGHRPRAGKGIDLVTSDGSTLLTTIVALDPIYFVFDMSEPDFLDYQRAVADGTLPSARDRSTIVQARLADEPDGETNVRRLSSARSGAATSTRTRADSDAAPLAGGRHAAQPPARHHYPPPLPLA